MIKIVKADLSFVDNILELENDLFVINKFTKNQIVDELKSNERHYVVAVYDDKVVGFAGLNILPDITELLKIAVSKEFQQKNIASKMLNYLKVFAKNKGYEKMLLEVSSNNIPAIQFYIKHGFVNLHVRSSYYEDNSNALVMELML